MLNPCRWITSPPRSRPSSTATFQPPPRSRASAPRHRLRRGLGVEPMARLGADVVGADAAAGAIPVAQLHAASRGLRSIIATPGRGAGRAGRDVRRGSQHGGRRAQCRTRARILPPARRCCAPGGFTSARPSTAMPEFRDGHRRRRIRDAAGCPRAPINGASSSPRTSSTVCCAAPGSTRWTARGSSSARYHGHGRSRRGT